MLPAFRTLFIRLIIINHVVFLAFALRVHIACSLHTFASAAVLDCTATRSSWQNSEQLQVCRVRPHEAVVEFVDCNKLTTMADSVEGLEIFILSGQSNMSGRGGVQIKTAKDGSTHQEWDGVVPAEAAYEPGSVLRLNKSLHWEDAHEPLHADIDYGKFPGKTCGVGPGLVFAASFLRAQKLKDKGTPTPVIGLIPCAIGGTSITQWEKGGKLYTQMINRTRAALKNGGKLTALLWYQGESDATEKHLADQYEENLINFFKNVRMDLNKDDLPIIQVAINWPSGNVELVDKVRNAQKAALDRIEHLYLVDALGLPLRSDNIHLTTEAQTAVGLMLADKYTSIMESSVDHLRTA